MKSALVISDHDNVATALEALEAGRVISVGGVDLEVRESIQLGHKIALAPIAAGDPVRKYGSPIGLATENILPGAHVHTHNLESSRGRGDLELRRQPAEPRLAEPPDEASRAGEAGPGDERPARGTGLDT